MLCCVASIGSVAESPGYCGAGQLSSGQQSHVVLSLCVKGYHRVLIEVIHQLALRRLAQE